MTKPEIPLRRCRSCENEFPETTEYFSKHRRCLGGLQTRCRTCVAASTNALKLTRIAMAKEWGTEAGEKPPSDTTRQIRKNLEALGHCEELGMTYYQAAVNKFREHVTACVYQGIPHDKFEKIASEILGAKTEAERITLLEPAQKLEPSQPTRFYEQYRSPAYMAEAGQSTFGYLCLLLLFIIFFALVADAIMKAPQ